METIILWIALTSNLSPLNRSLYATKAACVQENKYAWYAFDCHQVIIKTQPNKESQK